MLFETLRSFFSVNKIIKNVGGVQIQGFLTVLYKFCLCCLYPLQTAFIDFDLFRRKKQLISYCAWIHGQLTNVLNILYDASLKRIYITADGINNLFCPTFFDEFGATKESTIFAPLFADGESAIFAPTLQANTVNRFVTVHVPASLYSDTAILEDFDSTINQIKPETINYIILPI